MYGQRMAIKLSPSLESVAALLIRGERSYTRMAETLGISYPALRGRLHEIRTRLGVRSTDEAAERLQRSEQERLSKAEPKRCYRCSQLVPMVMWDEHETACLERCRRSAAFTTVQCEHSIPHVGCPSCEPLEALP
jgi:DNA-binding CsgD family transcriptional regulator